MPETTTLTAEAPLRPLRRLSDAELVARVCAGEQSAFEPIMRRYNQRLFRAARGVLGSDAEAEEVVQDAYIRAYSRLGQYSRRRSLGAWLTRIAVNEALMRRRRSDWDGSTTLEPFNDETVGAAMMNRGDDALPSPEEAAADEELGSVLERCIDQLPEAFRVAFVLREIEQLSVAETAESLRISKATVKTRVHRARRLLQRSVSKELRGAVGQAYTFAGHRCDRTVDAVFRRLFGHAGPTPGDYHH